ncbi:hypothetical protein K2173_000207 [Erythroxylum novogranatense]|uniref:GTP-binding protein n=1 Tax=Erythroxylum novogranatense TaxID=1862640 RepID=A0AAV8SVP1_9ROSI|nr:hypothetical protein K2173_000207 [Erythroxylum novogranatense]
MTQHIYFLSVKILIFPSPLDSSFSTIQSIGQSLKYFRSGHFLPNFPEISYNPLSNTNVDFKIKHLTVGGEQLKLTIKDMGLYLLIFSINMLFTTGQERFRTLTSSYYRNAQRIVLIYDATKRETFTNLLEIWAKEVELFCTYNDSVKMLVGNKVDQTSLVFWRNDQLQRIETKTKIVSRLRLLLM